jgi:hypothetical protein
MVDEHSISNSHSQCLASDQNAPVFSTAGGDRDSGSTSSIHPELSRSISSAAWQQTQCCSSGCLSPHLIDPEGLRITLIPRLIEEVS